ncbi:MAG: response regulator [Burkholderiaceae bacterium]|nr:response regulator [Burkholderiaceae bacterium]
MPSRPVYRVAAAGLDPRDVRLIEIVFKHSQYNRFEFVLEPRLVPETVDILIVNPVESDGLRALARLRTLGRDVPVISAVPRGAPSSARHAISIDRLTLQLLPILNRVVDMELVSPDTRPMAAVPAATPAAASAPAAAAASAPTSTPIPTRASADLPTRDFLREAGRLSREGDSARAAAPAPAADAAPSGARTGAPGSQPGATGSSNLVAFPLNGDAPAPQIRVLVVDDSPTVRKQLSLAFSRMRVECDAVASAAEALQRLAEHHYDLALVDVVMPEVDGYKLTRQIRRKHPGTPVIILTSRSSPFDLARGALAGCSTFLVKPVPLRQLEAAIVKQLRRSLAIDDLRGLIRLSGDAAQRAPQQGVSSAAPAQGSAPSGHAPRSSGR